MWFAVAAATALGGCAAPGEPTPPKPQIPAAVTDLTARQAGNGVELKFTLPKETTRGDPLAEPPAVEIYRAEAPENGSRRKVAARLVYTIPPALVETYLSNGEVEFHDPFEPGEIRGQQLLYMVRTRAARKRASDDSNAVTVRVFPAPAPPGGLRATVTESGVDLAWTPPVAVTAAPGTVGGALAGYRVYRAEVLPGTEPAAEKASGGARAAFVLLGPTPSAEFRDTHAEFGHTYRYTVRSVMQYDAESVESTDAAPVEVTPLDTFPPAAPGGLIAVVSPATAGSPPVVELSWDISPEPDLAGYRVYRSEQPDTRGQLLTPDLLPSPTFRDTSTVPGHRYTYWVTAVDHARNESTLSSAVSAEVPEQE